MRSSWNRCFFIFAKIKNLFQLMSPLNELIPLSFYPPQCAGGGAAPRRPAQRGVPRHSRRPGGGASTAFLASLEDVQSIHFTLQVLELTRELLDEATAQQEGAGAPSAPAAPVAAITEAPEVRLPSVLPPHVAQQIRGAQQRAALQGQGPAAWAIGAEVQARYSVDDNW